MIYKIMFAYFIIINILGIFLCIKDKYAAKKGYWRIKESTLLGFCLLGASIGVYLCMKLIRHKTKHKKFMIGIPIIIMFQLIISVIAILHI